MSAQATQAAPAAPVITLTSIKYAAFASQETACFEAIVQIDGRKFCHVSNEGHGGPDWFHPRNGQSAAQLEREMHEIALQINPEAYTRNGPTAKVETFTDEEWEKAYEGEWWKRGPHSDETIFSGIVGRLLDDHLAERDLKRALKGNLLALHEDGHVYRWKLRDKAPGAWAAHERAIREAAKKKGNPIKAVLNALPLAEAFAMYRGAAS